MSYEFKSFPKIPRLGRFTYSITEKLDGTNGIVHITPLPEFCAQQCGRCANECDGLVQVGALEAGSVAVVGNMAVFAGSRTRWVQPGKGTDNYGFAQWVRDNADELVRVLGEGTHYGEWWGQGIQRNYGLTKRRFTLFNTHRYQSLPTVGSEDQDNCIVTKVPLLSIGNALGGIQQDIDAVVSTLRTKGSIAAPGCLNPEGVVLYLDGTLHKVIINGDEQKVAG